MEINALKKEVSQLRKQLEESQSNGSETDESRVLEETSVEPRKIHHLRFKSSFTSETALVNDRISNLARDIKYVLHYISRCFLQEN